MKICAHCKIEKDLSFFHKNKSKKDGHNGICIDCRKIYLKKHYETNKQKYIEKSRIWTLSNKEQVLSRRYKVPKSIIIEIMKIGRCEICGTTEKLVYDHIHKTNEPRGCLCHSCNLFLGRLGDSNSEILDKIEIIRNYVTKTTRGGAVVSSLGS